MPSVLETELRQLRERVLFMGDLAEESIERGMRALVEHNTSLAEEVIKGDDRIDDLELKIDWACIRILALRSPEARDLRFVMGANRLVPILERIGDHACNLARAALAIGHKPPLRPDPDLLKMSGIAREMLRAALDAFAASDATTARAVIERDEEVNQLYDRLFHDLRERYTIVIVTHNLQQAARVADYTGFFLLGRLIEFGETDRIFTASSSHSV